MQFFLDFQLGLLGHALPQLEHLCYRKPQTDYISAAYAYLSIMFFQSISHDPFEKNVEDDGDGKHPCLTPTVILSQSPMLPFI